MKNKKKVEEYQGVPAEHREVNDVWLLSVMDILNDGGTWVWPAKGHSYTYSLVRHKLIPHTMQGYVDLRNILTYAGGETMVEKYSEDKVEVENAPQEPKNDARAGFTIFYDRDKERIMHAILTYCGTSMEFMATMAGLDINDKHDGNDVNRLRGFFEIVEEFALKSHDAGMCEDPNCQIKKK